MGGNNTIPDGSKVPIVKEKRVQPPYDSFPRVRNMYDVLTDPEGVDRTELHLSAQQAVRDEAVFHARTILLQEKIKHCYLRESYNASELCFPLVQQYLERLNRLGHVQIPERVIHPDRFPRPPNWQDKVSGGVE